MTTIGVSILNYEAARDTARCVAALLAAQATEESRYALQIHVADNASTAGDKAVLQQALRHFPQVLVHWHERNLGFAAGHNRNIEQMLSGEAPDFVWLLNNDCLVNEGTALALIGCAAQRPDTGIWGATLTEGDGRMIQCAGGCTYQVWLSSYRQHGKGTPLARLDSLKPGRFDYIAGASLFMPVSTLRDGLVAPPGQAANRGRQWLNEEFFLYFEELDLAKRLRPELGMGWCKAARIAHAGGLGTGATQGKRSPEAEYHATLSALKFTSLYYPRRLWLVAPARFVAKALQLVLTGQPRLIGPNIRAYRAFRQWLNKAET